MCRMTTCVQDVLLARKITCPMKSIRSTHYVQIPRLAIHLTA
jgi:hypothetical protein